MGENGYTFTLPETNIASETLRFQDEWNGLILFGRPTLPGTTVDGQIPAPPRMMINYPIIYRVLTIPGGCLGFRPSTVCWFLGV